MNKTYLVVLGGVVALASAGFANGAPGPGPMPVTQAASPAVVNVSVVSMPAAQGYPRGAELVAMSDGAAPSVRSGWQEPHGAQKPVYSSVLGAGPQAEPAKATEAPLPGALWLFGSALLAFLGICTRRRF